MAEKLKSIIARTPWSLLLKAAVFGLSWYYAPHWLAALVALVGYFLPVFPFSGTLLPFVIMLVLAIALPASGIGAVVLGTVFMLIVGSKELVFLGRNRAYETIVLLLIFLGSLEFFRNLFLHSSAFSFGQLAVGAFGAYFLLQALFRREALATQTLAEGPAAVHPHFAAALIVFLLAEFSGVIALTPMNLFYKTAFVLLAATVVIDLTLQYLQTRRNIQGMFFAFAIFFLLAVFMLVSNTWHP